MLQENEWIVEPEKKVPVIKTTDLIICGGGPAGICAAIAAARSGVRVLLIERYGFVGGMATTGLVNPIYGFGYFEEGKQIIRGIPEDIVQELLKMEGGTLGHRRRSECKACSSIEECPTNGISSLLCFDPEAFKYVAIKMLEDAGVDLLLHSLIVEVSMQDDTITGIIIENKSGRSCILAKIVIDATGDGDVAALAGNPYEFGRPQDGAVQPNSVILRIGNVMRNEDRIAPDQIFPDPQNRIALPSVFLFRLPGKGEYIVNYDCGIYDANPLKAEDLTRVQVKAVKEAGTVIEALRKYSPGCRDTYLLSTAVHVGIRESRRIIGDYVLTKDDVVSARKFDDGVAKVAFPIDIHNPTGSVDEKNPMVGPKCGDYYEIPYRSLVPQKIDNLLVAGRCISGTHEAHGSYRLMGPCMTIGQAAGTAAALSIEEKVSPRKIDTKLLRKTLIKEGVLI